MEITSISTKYNARMGGTQLEWNVNQEGELTNLSGQAYGEQGQYLGGYSRQSDGSANANAAPGASLAALAADMEQALEWVEAYLAEHNGQAD